jgi:hypothetical protein
MIPESPRKSRVIRVIESRIRKTSVARERPFRRVSATT